MNATAKCSGSNLHITYTQIPRPSKYPLLGPKYLLLMAIHPQLRVLGGFGIYIYIHIITYIYIYEPGPNPTPQGC